MSGAKIPPFEEGGYIFLKDLWSRIKELLSKAKEVRYVSVPVWRPWRDF